MTRSFVIPTFVNQPSILNIVAFWGRLTGYSQGHNTKLATDLRCASAAASPTSVDVKQLNKLVRSIRFEPCVLRYWPLKGKLRLIGYLDAAVQEQCG